MVSNTMLLLFCVCVYMFNQKLGCLLNSVTSCILSSYLQTLNFLIKDFMAGMGDMLFCKLLIFFLICFFVLVTLATMCVVFVLHLFHFDLASCLLQELVDIDVFLEAKRVIDSLQNKEVAPALVWCAENKSRLKRSKVCFDLCCYVFNNS